MSDKVELSTFPSSRIDGLTMLYLSQQNISDLSPEELVEKYIDVKTRIHNKFRECRK